MSRSETAFTPGMALSRAFYREAVRPILAAQFPSLPYAAALVGYGSDVLGFDDVTSRDHNWGPRLQLFLAPDDHGRLRDAVDDRLARELPHTFRGYPVNFSEPDPADGGTQRMEAGAGGPVRHLVEIETVPAYFRRYLGVGPDDPLAATDWLLIPEQGLLEMTAGEVFHDGLSALEAARARLSYYPRDVWLYRMAVQWARLSQEEAFLGRCGQVGDDLGSRIVAARLVRDLIRLAFMLERRYAPYGKWLGTAFGRLRCSLRLGPLLQATLAAPDWQSRQQPLARAYELVAGLHNDLAVTPPLDPAVRPFFNRLFPVIFGDRFAGALREAIVDESLRVLPLLGSVDQFADCTDLTEDPVLMHRLRALYEPVDA